MQPRLEARRLANVLPLGDRHLGSQQRKIETHALDGVTLEIDAGRHHAAVANLKAAGLDGYVDARLGDAHELVRSLSGPFDFVFSDADKNWYTRYFVDVDPKLVPGGCTRY